MITEVQCYILTLMNVASFLCPFACTMHPSSYMAPIIIVFCSAGFPSSPPETQRNASASAQGVGRQPSYCQHLLKTFYNGTETGLLQPAVTTTHGILQNETAWLCVTLQGDPSKSQQRTISSTITFSLFIACKMLGKQQKGGNLIRDIDSLRNSPIPLTCPREHRCLKNIFYFKNSQTHDMFLSFYKQICAAYATKLEPMGGKCSYFFKEFIYVYENAFIRAVSWGVKYFATQTYKKQKISKVLLENKGLTLNDTFFFIAPMLCISIRPGLLTAFRPYL